MKGFISKAYILVFMGFIVFYMYIIWNVTFGHMVEEYRYRKNTQEIAQNKESDKKESDETSFKKAILESDERVKHYLGYRVLEEKRIEGHFRSNLAMVQCCEGIVLKPSRVRFSQPLGNIHKAVMMYM